MISKRVSEYQSKINEILWFDHLIEKADEHTIYNENLLILNDQFYQRLLDLCQIHLTKNQYKIMRLLTAGKTQQEIAKQLNINQSSVNHNIHGAFNGTIYTGGLIWKIKHCLVRDPICRRLYQEMELAQDVLYCSKHKINLSIYNAQIESPANFYNYYPIIKQQIKHRNSQ